MKINVKNLLEVLTAVNAAITNKEVLQQSDSFIFLKKGIVCSFNDELAIHAKCPVKLQGSVKAKDLLQLLNKIKDEEVSIKHTGNELRIKGKSTRAGLTFIQDISLPLEDVDDPGKWISLPEDFDIAIKRCLPACSSNMNRPALTCIHIHKNIAEASDGVKMSRHTFKKKIKFIKEILFPAHSAAIIANKPVKYFSMTDGWLHFTDHKKEGSIIYSCRVFKEKFPNLDAFVVKKGDRIKFPPKMADMLETVAVFSEDEIANREMVEISIEGKQGTITSKNNNGWVSEKFKIDKKQNVKFRTDPNLLRDLLKNKGSVEITDNTLSIKSKNFIHIVAIMA